MRRGISTLLALVLIACIGLSAQTQKSEKKRLTNADIAAMVKAGLAESTIILVIQHSESDFDTSPQALIALKNGGVSQKVLDAMLTAGAEKAAAPAGPTGTQWSRDTGGEKGGKWEMSEQVSPMDGSRTGVLILRAEQEIPTLVGLDRYPRLCIRCKSHETDAYIQTGTLPSDPDRGGRFAVRLRLDDG